MTLVCGTDFSELSQQAVTAAGHLAARTKMPLHLVYVLESNEYTTFDAPQDALVSWATGLLSRKAERLRKLGATVETHVKSGPPDEVLLELAGALSANLIIVAALGQRKPEKWQLGSHAERLAQRSHIPVLVVRDLEPFEKWVDGSRPLRIVVGADFSQSSDAALHWIEALEKFGPCDIVATHLYWPPQQFQRLGLSGVRSYLEPDSEVTLTLERDLSQRISSIVKNSAVKIRPEPHLGRVADRLVQIADEEKADLIVVGSYHRGTLGLLWEGSVSRGVLRYARSSVACVPISHAASKRQIKALRCVLVPTDFSLIGDAAIALAYSVVEHGGCVHLLHVRKSPSKSTVEPQDIFQPYKSDEEALRMLTSLIPDGAREQGKSTQTHVVHSDKPADAISQAAERLNADVICMGTHGHTGLKKVLLGSVAQAVLEQSVRPVLLAHYPEPQ